MLLTNSFNRESVLVKYAHLIAWAVFLALSTNALWLIVSVSNPVIRSDAWYFLDVFVRKALNGQLQFSDFFVKRLGADHAQPMFKLALLFELRFFDLDFSVEAIIGFIAASACCLILRQFILTSPKSNGSGVLHNLAWAAMCAVIFSTNAIEIWTWPLVTIEYLTIIPMLLFIWATWDAWQHERYTKFSVATIFLGVADDDSAVIAIAATLLGIALLLIFNKDLRNKRLWKLFVVLIVLMTLIRWAYSYAPRVGGAPTPSFINGVGALGEHIFTRTSWRWLISPLVMSIVAQPLFPSHAQTIWPITELSLAISLVLAHGWFWYRVTRSNYNLAVFAAICIMILTYGWIAGILIYRVPTYGVSYINQGRYIRLYEFNLVALLLMFAGSFSSYTKKCERFYLIGRRFFWAACLVLIGIQAPLTRNAWSTRTSMHSYYHKMAIQIFEMASTAESAHNCAPELVVCEYSASQRKDLIQLLASHRLNVFSQRLPNWHPYLPQWQATTGEQQTHGFNH